MALNGGLEIGLPVRTEVPRCSCMRVFRCLSVLPIYDAWQLSHVYLYTRDDSKFVGILSFIVKRLPIVLPVLNMTLTDNWGYAFRSNLLNLFFRW